MEFLAGIITGLVVCIIITAVTFYFDDREAEKEEQAETVVDDWTNSDQIIKSRDWDGDDSKILAQVAMYYAQSDSIETKMLVVLTCLNRMWTQLADGEQTDIPTVASEMTDGHYASYNPTEECYKAVNRVQYDGWDRSLGALYIVAENDDEANRDQTLAGHEYLYTHGGYNFYK